MSYDSKHLQTRRERFVKLAEEIAPGQRVFFRAGNRISIPGCADQTYPFRAHSDFLYLTECNRPGAILVLDPESGWELFEPYPSTEDKVWIGDWDPVGSSLSGFDEQYGQTSGQILELGASTAKSTLATSLQSALHAARRVKDADEISKIRAAATITAKAFQRLPDLLTSLPTEIAVRNELEAEFLRGGASGSAFETIIAAGTNAAVLHWHPTQSPIQSGQLVLIDAGAEKDFYCADVSRTYVVGGTPDSRQSQILAIVREAEQRAIECCKPGVPFVDVHMKACEVILAGLSDLGLVQGEVSGLLEQGVAALFFPHGVGHLVGLGVRDATFRESQPENNPNPNLRTLRHTLPLEEGTVVTIEPGLYFIPELWNLPRNRQAFKDCIQWTQLEKWVDFGGVRIEDDILVGSGGPEVLSTDIPY